MRHLQQLGSKIGIRITADETGFTGRECPNSDCEGYFKIQFGTGLTEQDLSCHCPYCGHTSGHDQFWTTDQIEYARSAVLRQISDAIYKDLKKLEFEHKPRGAFGIGLSMKIKPGLPLPIRCYREKQLETEVLCGNCTLRYSVYGVFAFCPDCGQHNSTNILDKNLSIVEKMLGLASNAEQDLREKLVENALEDCISAFDGFGRELCHLHAHKSLNPAKVEKMSFQNLDGARTNVSDVFAVNLSASMTLEEWRIVTTAFQKRHLIAHKMGIVDQDYVTKTRDTHAVVGRKIVIRADEVIEVVRIVRKLGNNMSAALEQIP